MVEAGAFFGIDMKLRATYYPLATEYINDVSVLTSDKGSLQTVATGTGNFVASLLIFPYSNRWGDD